MMLAQRFDHLGTKKEVTQRCVKFFEVARYVALEKARVSGDPAVSYELDLSEGVRQVLKSAVSAGSTTGWGQPLAPYTQLADAFLLSLRSVSAFDAMSPWMKAVPLHQQIVVASGGATAAVVAEGNPKPIAKLQFSVNQITETKTICIVAVTKELLRNGNNKLFAEELTRAIANATDSAFITKITAGIAPASSNGGTSVAILQDLAAVLDGLTLDATSKVFLITGSDIAKRGR
jgi:HK97 family phage major capsid protein